MTNAKREARSGALTNGRRLGGPASPRLPRQFQEACLLLLIGIRPAHGYDLRAQLRELAGAHDVGQMYRTLRRLEEDGLVVSCWQHSAVGPARRTYHISERGTVRLDELAQQIAAGHRLTGAFLERCSSADRSQVALA